MLTSDGLKKVKNMLTQYLNGPYQRTETLILEFFWKYEKRTLKSGKIKENFISPLAQVLRLMLSNVVYRPNVY